MREIKFRVWHKNYKEMYEVKSIHFGTQKIIIGCKYGNRSIPFEDIELMQYIGLKDKNGKEIYEGDILKGFEYPYYADENHNYFVEVVWFENCPAFGMYTFKNPKSKVCGISEGNSDIIEGWQADKWEVIGNKFDNPELLKNTNKQASEYADNEVLKSAT